MNACFAHTDLIWFFFFNFQQNEKENKNIFTKYSELGEKIPYRNQYRKSKLLSSDECEKEQVESQEDGEMNGDFPAKQVLPEIKDQVANGSDKTTNGHLSDGDESDEELMTLSKVAANEEPDVNENFRELQVSPVQTPVVFRPITRHKARENSDNMADILKGDVHPPCVAESKSVSLYVSAGFTGKYS